jgi:hypothetical protein
LKNKHDPEMLKCTAAAFGLNAVHVVSSSAMDVQPVRFAGLLWLKILFAGLL